jgi:exosortase/archaeosortase family protein
MSGPDESGGSEPAGISAESGTENGTETHVASDAESAAAGSASGRVVGRTLPRYAAGAVVCSVAALALIYQDWYRGAEAALAGDAVGQWLGFPVLVARAQQTMFFAFHGTGDAHMLGLQVTLGCSSDLLIAPLLLITGLLLGLGHASAGRIVAAAAVAASIVVIVNVLRLVMIAEMVNWWGAQTGFGWGHTLFGSVLTLVGMFAALTAFIVVFNRGGRLRHAATRTAG